MVGYESKEDTKDIYGKTGIMCFEEIKLRAQDLLTILECSIVNINTLWVTQTTIS